jgi:hypothetical protein
MEPKMTVTLTVHARGEPGLLVTLPGNEKFNIPLTETPDSIAGLVRELAGLVVAHARREVDAVAERLGAVAKDKPAKAPDKKPRP